MNTPISRTDLLTRLLSVASLRQRVIAQNVANVNTPGYREREVLFEEVFSQKLRFGGTEEAQRTVPRVVEGPGGATRVDGNNVDIDQEMTALAKNSLLYKTLAQALTTRLSAQRTAIAGR